MDTISSLKKIFKNQALFTQALTHRSWVNEHKGERTSNERLEFLGDAILEFVITEHIFDQFPNEQEGYLTSLRANLVNTQNLAALALKLGVGSELYLSRGEEEGGGRENTSLLADTVEAIIGALYLDQGLELVKEFVKSNLVTEIPDKVKSPLKDPKSRLQEYIQSKGGLAPNYKVIEESGPDHEKRFIIDVIVSGESWGKGEGKSKNQAEQAAAEKALEKAV